MNVDIIFCPKKARNELMFSVLSLTLSNQSARIHQIRKKYKDPFSLVQAP